MPQASDSKMTLVAVLALAQGVLAVFRSLHWFDIGSDLIGRGILLLPVMAIFAYASGALAVVIALLYLLFALGEFAGRGWGRSCGAVAAVLNLLLAVAAVFEAEDILRVALWAVVPVIVLWHVFAREQGRAAHAPAAS
ncbi:MAG TPA: hypothetical protein VGH16_17620 [Candidatus Binatia bacterium]|jgi:hypothetical protein